MYVRDCGFVRWISLCIVFMGMDGLGLQRQSSIENEPRTLSIHQIDFAREAALYVVNTRSIDEALSIFTEGLEPQPVVICTHVGECNNTLIDGRNNDEKRQTNRYNEKIRVRDVVSAPF